MNILEPAKNILDLFGGCNMGRVACERAGIKVGNYYCSEIDKYAMQIGNKNYPLTVQLGDINNWREWPIEFRTIDIILAGFPCQPWSVAGNGKGLEDLRGQVVYPMVELWQHITALNPSVKFIFENVKIPKDRIQFINDLFGFKPVLINSSLVSAQNRERYYWSNIPITQPEDKGLVLKDVLGYSRSTRYRDENGKVHSSPAPDRTKYVEHRTRDNGKANTLTTRDGCGSFSSKNFRPCKTRRKYVLEGSKCHHVATATDIKGNESIKRVYAETGKSPTLTTMQGGHRQPKVLTHPDLYRKLTPLECERLQTLPDNYTEGVSNTQRYKMIGNGWTVDVVAHILRGINEN